MFAIFIALFIFNFIRTINTIPTILQSLESTQKSFDSLSPNLSQQEIDGWQQVLKSLKSSLNWSYTYIILHLLSCTCFLYFALPKLINIFKPQKTNNEVANT